MNKRVKGSTPSLAKCFYEDLVIKIFVNANMSMQYTAIFHGCKNDNFQMNFFFYIFLIFAQNRDCVYTLEPPYSLEPPQ